MRQQSELEACFWAFFQLFFLLHEINKKSHWALLSSPTKYCSKEKLCRQIAPMPCKLIAIMETKKAVSMQR